MNRTAEWSNSLELIRATMAVDVPAKGCIVPVPPVSTTLQQLSSSIVSSASGTASLLRRLMALARNTSLVEDPASEIQRLSSAVRSRLKGQEQQISTLAQQVHQHAPELPGQMADHWRAVLRTVNGAVTQNTKQFEVALRLRQQSLVQLEARRRALGAMPGQELGIDQDESDDDISPLPAQAFVGNDVGGGATARQRRGARGGDGSDGGLVEAPAYGDTALCMEVDVEHQHAAHRLREAEAVEGALVQLGEMFRRLGTLVATQGETVEAIDENLAAAEADTSAAQSELFQVYASVSKNRGLILKTFGVVGLVIVLLILFKR
jgi:hypothetical protein